MRLALDLLTTEVTEVNCNQDTTKRQGGLYKSTNGGANWTALFDFDLESLAIGAITIDPADSSIVYLGTGEPNQSADSFAGRGLYIIRNANSATPTLTGPFRLNGTGADIFTGRAIGRIVVNPLDNNVIFVSTTSGTGGNPNTTPFTLPPRGLYRSTNAQSASPTFEQVQVTGVPTPNDRTMIDIVADPADPNLLFVTVIGVTGDGGIYRTADALAAVPTFTRTLTLPNGTGFRAELTATRNATAGTTFYTATGELNPAVCTGGSATRGGAVRRSTDGGLTWSPTLSGSAGFCGGQCFYDIAIAVTPDNQTIHLGGAARSGTAGLCNIDVMKRSTNGGANWEPYGTGLPAVAVFDLKLSNVQRILRIATHGRGIWETDIDGEKLPILRSGGAAITAEGCAPGNGAIDPGEDVTVSFGVTNIGAGPTSNLVVTLLPTGGVMNPSGPQSYGAIDAGATEAREFQFTANGTCGGTITLTFHLQDGSTDYGNLTVTFTLGQLVTGAPAFTENFDGVTAPALPGGWTTANTGAAPAWVTSTTSSSSAPNSAFGGGAATASSNSLDSPQRRKGLSCLFP
ncbi:MAG TPA: hypothetical protein VJ715_11635 [Pyrinomonadaceae bacterium]|nr:hypothetical protein [Pyrinomonadaceae bacterium]